MSIRNFLSRFDDKKRGKIRERHKWSLFIDFCLTSESTDYAKLRFTVNLVIGFIISIGAYYLVWQKINFATQYHKVPHLILKWAIILGNAVAFAYSKSYRCGLWIFILGVFGMSGQNLLIIFVSDSVREGPIDNIVANFKIATDNVICGVKISSDMAVIRTKTLIGPMRETLKNTLLKALSFKDFFIGVQPQDEQQDDSQIESDEQKQNRMIDQAALNFAQRAQMSNSKERNFTFKRPFYTKFKDTFVRKLGLNLQEQCTRIFDKGTLICHKAFETLKQRCRENTPFLLTGLICKPLDALELCEDDKRKEEGYNLCNEEIGKNLPHAFEQESIDMRNISKQIAEEMETKIRVAAVEAPRVSSSLHIKNLQAKIRHLMQLSKEVVRSLQSLLAALLIFVIYLNFNDGLRIADNYTKDLAFENRNLSDSFWKIDKQREAQQRKDLPFIGKLTRLEKKQLGIRNRYFDFPKWRELMQLWLPTSKFLTLCQVVAVLVAVDHLFYRMMLAIVDGIPKGLNNTRLPEIHFNVTGEGLFSNMLKDLFTAKNKTVEQMVVLDDCLIEPIPPDYGLYVLTILLPLLFMFVSQILLSFLPKRIVLLCFLPFMFPRRARARMIWLYNVCLKYRLDAREEARRRIAFFVKWRKENKGDEDEDEGLCFCFAKESFIRRKIVDNIFRAYECFMCQSYLRAWSTYQCERCPATYCKFCWDEMKMDCYACQVERHETIAS